VTVRDWEPTASTQPPACGHPGRISKLDLLKRFRSEKRDPDGFYGALVAHTLAAFPFPLEGQQVLDVGCGDGYFTEALRQAGARVIATDLDVESVTRSSTLRGRAAISDGGALPCPDAVFDGVFCSNVLEHTPDPAAIFAEIERVLRDGGWAYVSWTNWYSPWGGHAIAPFHYLGPRRGELVYRRVVGEPRGPNLPFVNLWVTHIGSMLRLVRSRPGLTLTGAHPRYYPSQRWIVRVPGLREVATWNCVLLLRRKPR
jgi:SAM-dependent methyltransferase